MVYLQRSTEREGGGGGRERGEIMVLAKIIRKCFINVFTGEYVFCAEH